MICLRKICKFLYHSNTLYFNYFSEFLVDRIGRTGRLGNVGVAYHFYSETEDRAALTYIRKVEKNYITLIFF